MNKNTLGRFLGVAAVLAAAPHVQAQQAPRCSDLYDDAQRLACYDAAFGKPARPSGATTAPRAPAATSAPLAPSAPAVRTAPVAAPAVAEEPPKNVSAGISAIARRADGRFVVTLDNGQVWSQLERDMAAEIAAGDKVTIRRGMLGSYILITRAGVQTKVKSGK